MRPRPQVDDNAGSLPRTLQWVIREWKKRLPGADLAYEMREHGRNAVRYVQYVREASRVPAGSVVFYGSSSVVRFPLADVYPGAPAINRGLGMENVVDQIRRVRWTMPSARPSGVVLFTGMNDLRAEAMEPTIIAEHVGRLFDAILARFPGVPIVLVEVPPWCDQTAVDLDRLARLNAAFARLAVARGSMFVRANRPPLIDVAGCLSPAMAAADRKHLSHAGYEVLARWIREDGGDAVRSLRV